MTMSSTRSAGSPSASRRARRSAASRCFSTNAPVPRAPHARGKSNDGVVSGRRVARGAASHVLPARRASGTAGTRSKSESTMSMSLAMNTRSRLALLMSLTLRPVSSMSAGSGASSSPMTHRCTPAVMYSRYRFGSMSALPVGRRRRVSSSTASRSARTFDSSNRHSLWVKWEKREDVCVIARTRRRSCRTDEATPSVYEGAAHRIVCRTNSGTR
mmetsp:Transcript_13664/g.42958  ORF Transcript_13664/g.42958 Transcript_13664/m.42958 type:complete len:215 (-) Transcript_13664:63-707(-)